MDLFEIDNQLVADADSYIRKHKIMELFEDMLTMVVHKRPEEVEQFMIDILKQRKEHGSRWTIYSEAELQNTFLLFDLKSDNYITKDKWKEALKTLANSEFHFSKADCDTIPDKVDLYTFIKLCNELLGIRPR